MAAPLPARLYRRLNRPTPDATFDSEQKAYALLDEICAWADTPVEAQEVLDILCHLDVDFAARIAAAEEERRAGEQVWFEEHARRSLAQQARYRQRRTRCCGCYQLFPRSEMRPGSECRPWGIPDGWYCPDCYQKGQSDWDRQRTRTCAHCGAQYLANQFTILLCPACDTQPLRREHIRVLSNLNRARRAGLPATLTLREWLSAVHYFDGKCAYCRTRPFTEMEHFVPIELGGGTTANNCVPACGICNRQKGMLNPDLPGVTFPGLENVRAYLRTIGGDDLFSKV